MDKFIIDPEFQDMIPPLTEEEFTQLEKNILSDGAVFSPLIVWDNTILDGHNRYEIIQKHPELACPVHKLDFSNRYEALSWICKNQLGRRNLTPEQKKYLIGQRYEAEKMIRGGSHKESTERAMGNDCPLASSPHVTRAKIAQDTNMTESFVKEAGKYARGVDAAEEAVPGIKREILTGEIAPPHKAVAAVAKAPPEKRPELAAALRSTKSKRGGSRKKNPGKRADMAKIAEISAEMERPKPQITEESLIFSLDSEITSIMEVFDRFFQEYPRLLSNVNNKQKVIRVMQRFSDYIAEIAAKQ